MIIDFYYWNYQCPISYETIELLEKYKNVFKVNLYDVSDKQVICSKIGMYFPFLTIFNESIRWRGPLTQEIIEKFIEGEILLEKPYVINQGIEEFQGEILELNRTTVSLLAKGCTMNDCSKSCYKKGIFLNSIGSDIFGILNMHEGTVVGGVEFVPSLKIPYDVPKNEDTAFLTCLYHSSDKYDFKAYPLRKLEERLSVNYKEIIAITDEFGTFPNGNLEWFIKQGYKDSGLISEEEGYCKLHLVRKRLNHK